MRLSKPEINCLLNGKEPTIPEVAAIVASLNPSNRPWDFKTLRERLESRKTRDAAIMEELARQREEIDQLKNQMMHVLASQANKRLKLGK